MKAKVQTISTTGMEQVAKLVASLDGDIANMNSNAGQPLDSNAAGLKAQLLNSYGKLKDAYRLNIPQDSVCRFTIALTFGEGQTIQQRQAVDLACTSPDRTITSAPTSTLPCGIAEDPRSGPTAWCQCSNYPSTLPTLSNTDYPCAYTAYPSITPGPTLTCHVHENPRSTPDAWCECEGHTKTLPTVSPISENVCAYTAYPVPYIWTDPWGDVIECDTSSIVDVGISGVAVCVGESTTITTGTPHAVQPPTSTSFPTQNGCEPKMPVGVQQFYVYNAWAQAPCQAVGILELCSPPGLGTFIAPYNDWNCDWLDPNTPAGLGSWLYSPQWDPQPKAFSVTESRRVCDVERLDFTLQCDG
jgi:hypothetical protein